MRANEFITEAWSQKYKNSINCSHPKGFSQKAHCAGKKKHNEDITMEMVCPDCGMCETHGNLNEIKKGQKDSNGFTKCWPNKHAEGTKKGKNGGWVRKCVPNEDIDLEEQFDIIESMVEFWAEQQGVDSEKIWEDLEDIDDQDLLSEAETWQKSSGKNKNGGLNKKGVASYRRSHPGSHLQTAVTTKPSKLKKGSKASKRRKSFCARMKGMKKHRTGSKTAHDPNSRINKSLRKWNCESIEQLYDVLEMLKENFADGKNPGRKGLAKRSGVNTKASVSSLRNTAKHSSGEKQRMAHWLANMKAGKAKKK